MPSVMKVAPTHPSPRYARKRVRGGPRNSASTSIANDPKAAKIEVCGCPITLSANAKTAGMTIAARAALFSAAMFSTVGDDTSERASEWCRARRRAVHRDFLGNARATLSAAADTQLVSPRGSRSKESFRCTRPANGVPGLGGERPSREPATCRSGPHYHPSAQN